MACVKCGVKPAQPSAVIQQITLGARATEDTAIIGSMKTLSILTVEKTFTLRPGRLTLMPRSQAKELQEKGGPIWIVN